MRGVPRGEVGPGGERRAQGEGEPARGGRGVGAPELDVVERERLEPVAPRVGADEAAVPDEAEPAFSPPPQRRDAPVVAVGWEWEAWRGAARRGVARRGVWGSG